MSSGSKSKDRYKGSPTRNEKAKFVSGVVFADDLKGLAFVSGLEDARVKADHTPDRWCSGPCLNTPSNGKLTT